MSIVLASTVLALASAHALNGVVPTSAGAASVLARAASSAALGVHHGRVLDSGYASRPGQARLLGTYSTNNADFHAQENGKLWISSNPIIGPEPSARTKRHEVPGPAAYGVSEHDRTVILVRVGMTSFGISPWQRIEGRALRRLEAARLRWLEENGYGSGVRTFVNDAYAPVEQHAVGELQRLPDGDLLVEAGKPVDAKDIQPRATIRIPAEMPRFRKRMDVRGPTKTILMTPAIAAKDDRTGEVQVRTIVARSNSSTPTIVVRSEQLASAQ